MAWSSMRITQLRPAPIIALIFSTLAIAVISAGATAGERGERSERSVEYVDPHSGVAVQATLDSIARELNVHLTVPSGVLLNARYGVWVSALPGTGIDWSGELPLTYAEDREYFDNPVSIEVPYRPQRGQATTVALKIEYGWCDLEEGICVPAETILRF